MSNHWRVVVEGGGHNLYLITEYEGTYRVYKVDVNLLEDDWDLIGTEDSFEDAVEEIKQHSGQEIEEIT